MSVQVLKNQIISWLKNQDYWFQYAGNILLENETVTDEHRSKIYQYLLEDYTLAVPAEERSPVGFKDVAEDLAAHADSLVLEFIKDVDQVNALAKGQSIKIGPNLTIIYGANGAGKSGYIRLMNNAFISRGDKKIVKNVFDAAAGSSPSCVFTFKAASGSYDLGYPTNKERAEFFRYSVFDSESVRVQLEQENKLTFTPNGFGFFDRLGELLSALKTKLSADIIKSKPTNDFASLFVNENVYRERIASLSANSNEQELRGLGNYTEEDTEKHEALMARKDGLKLLDIPKQIDDLQKLGNQFETFIQGAAKGLEAIRKEGLESYAQLIASHSQLQELARNEGLKSLEGFAIKNLASNEWKDFIQAAKRYALVVEDSHEQPYPKDTDSCLFCLQPLKETELALINSYWNLLKSEAAKQLAESGQKISDAVRKLKQFPPLSFDEGMKIHEYTASIDVALAERWRTACITIETSRQNAISSLTSGEINLVPGTDDILLSEFDAIIAGIKKLIADLVNKNPAAELLLLEREIQELNDKKLLSKLLDKILERVASYKWASKAESAGSSAFRTNSITTKQGELFSEHINDKYTLLFNQECQRLNAPKIVDIAQKNTRGSSLRRLQVKGYVANQILSEGEQKAISLADFLTETQLNPMNLGVIFDDPVTSLDHVRKELIAGRLVELAKEKQVIIFTHDISFLVRLKILAENESGLDLQVTTMRRFKDMPGLIHPDLPWVAQNIKSRIGSLTDRLVRLKKVEKEQHEDDYLFAAKIWYGLLRETWERAVEERLLKGVVERFGPGVQTQKLKKIIITPELLAEIDKGMSESSDWMHDSAMALNPTPPSTVKAELDLKSLKDFSDKCVAA